MLTKDMENNKKGKQAEPKIDRINILERCVAKMAHYNGTNRIIDEFNIPRWEPGKDDMTKYK